jgi:lipoate-protein ligase A
MDPLSLTANIVAVLSLAVAVVEYIKDVNDAPLERIRLCGEINSASEPLKMLRKRIEEEQERNKEDTEESSKAWMSSVMELGAPNGSLDQFRKLLEELQRGLVLRQGRFKQLGTSLTWPFKRKGFERLLKVIERKKTLFQLALQNDNL